MRFVCMAVQPRLPIVSYLQGHILDLIVCMDLHRDPIANYRRALSVAGNHAMVLLEDDIVITRNFVAKVIAAIEEQPACLVQMHSRTKEDRTKGSRWRPASTFYNNQCVYFPPGMAADIIEYSRTKEAEEYLGQTIGAHDRMTAFYLASRGIKRYWNHCPSLAEHLPIVSMLDARRSKGRQSTTFADPEWGGHPLAEKLVGWIK